MEQRQVLGFRPLMPFPFHALPPHPDASLLPRFLRWFFLVLPSSEAWALPLAACHQHRAMGKAPQTLRGPLPDVPSLFAALVPARPLPPARDPSLCETQRWALFLRAGSSFGLSSWRGLTNCHLGDPGDETWGWWDQGWGWESTPCPGCPSRWSREAKGTAPRGPWCVENRGKLCVPVISLSKQKLFCSETCKKLCRKATARRFLIKKYSHGVL